MSKIKYKGNIKNSKYKCKTEKLMCNISKNLNRKPG